MESHVIKARMFRCLKRTSVAAGIVVVLIGSWAGYLRLSGNFHAVEEGLAYRSGQLSGSQLETRISQNQIRTVINLRGNNAGARWYDDEIKASAATGVHHVDFALSSGKELSDDQLARLTALLRDSPHPILIHCEAGADRSGLASALYELVVANRTPAEASAQLSFRYGHFPWFRNSTAAMDRTFERVLAQTRMLPN
jgi:protein tyrosine/serine phosphatase